MKKQDFLTFPFMPNLRAVAEQNNEALKCVFNGRIKGRFLLDINFDLGGREQYV